MSTVLAIEVERAVSHLIGSSEWIRTNCPACLERHGSADYKRSMSVNSESGFFKCFRCEARGWIHEEGRVISAPAPKQWPLSPELDSGFQRITSDAHTPREDAAPFVEYLRYRGVDQRVCLEAQLLYAVAGYWAGRVIVPIWSHGVLLGWSARSIHKGVTPKYLYPKGMPRGTSVYNGDAIKLDTENTLYVVEGVFDALALWPNAVAVLGKPTGSQVELISATTRPVAVAMDGDAWRHGWAMAAHLKLAGCQAVSVQLPPQEDPATLGSAWLSQAAKAAFDKGSIDV